MADIRPAVGAGHGQGGRGRHKVRVGRVVSHKMQKTVVVEVHWKQPHPKYKKLVNKITRLKVHDEKQETKVGDLVRIVEGRPLSKEKRWRLSEVLKRGQIAELKPAEIEETTLAELAAKQRPVTSPESRLSGEASVEQPEGQQTEIPQGN